MKIGDKVWCDGCAWYVQRIGETSVQIMRGLVTPEIRIVLLGDVRPIDEVAS